MATITAANVQAITDSVAKHLTDLQALLASPAAVQTGQGTTLGKIAALNDQSQEFFLLDGFEAFVASESALLGQWQSYNSMLDATFAAAAAVDNATTGLGAFLVTNALQVHPFYLDAHNRAVARRQLAPGVALGPLHAFGKALPNLGQVNVTGSGVGTFVAGTGQGNSPAGAGAAYGNAPLSIFNAGTGATGAASGTYTVTYNQYNASGVLVTGLTASATMPASSAAGFAVSLAVSGVAVTNITLTGGTNGDKVGCSAALLRTPAY